ncbi:MAG: hypothetical protein U0Q15_10465 [Kineosporiaceae bacterium]
MGKRKRRDAVVERLRRAEDEQVLVTVDPGREADDIDGYVVGVGEVWFVLALLDDRIVLDGWAALRIADVRAVHLRRQGEWMRPALRQRGQWPPAAPTTVPELDTPRGPVESWRHEPLVTVHDEQPDRCYIGVARGLDERFLRLQEVTPRAAWTDRLTKYPVDEITRIDIGGRYEEALLISAGPPPAV